MYSKKRVGLLRRNQRGIRGFITPPLSEVFIRMIKSPLIMIKLFLIKVFITDGWFSVLFQPAVKWLAWLSPGSCLNRFFGKRYKETRGVSESYVLVRLILGVLWLSLINTRLMPFMASSLAWILGSIFAVWLMFDIFIFTLKWIFTETEPVEDVRRSLFFFFINIVEIALFSSIALILSRCANDPPWCVFYKCFRSIFKFELFEVSGDCGLFGKLLIHFQLVIGVLLILVIIAGLAGSIRKGKDDKENIQKQDRRVKDMDTKDGKKPVDYVYQLLLVLLGAGIALGSSWVTQSWQETKERKELVNHIKGSLEHDIGRVDSFINYLQPYLNDPKQQLAAISFRWQHEINFLQTITNRVGSLDIPVIKGLNHYYEMVEQSKAFRNILRECLGANWGDTKKCIKQLQAYLEVLRVQKRAAEDVLKIIEDTYH